MSFKSFAGVVLISILGIMVMSGSDKEQSRGQVGDHPNNIQVEFYDFKDPIYITPTREIDASLGR